MAGTDFKPDVRRRSRLWCVRFAHALAIFSVQGEGIREKETDTGVAGAAPVNVIRAVLRRRTEWS